MPQFNWIYIILGVANIFSILNLIILSSLIYNMKLNKKYTVLCSLALGTLSTFATFHMESSRFILQDIIPNEFCKFFFSIIVSVAALRYLFKLSFPQSVIAMGIYAALQALGNVFAYATLIVLGYSDPFDFNTSRLLIANIVIILTNILSFIFIHHFKLFSKFPREVRNKAYISNAVYILFTILIIGANMIYYSSGTHPGRPGIIFTALLILAYLIYSIVNTNTFYRLEQKDQELKYQIFYNQTLDMLMNDLTRFKHNYSNMLNVAYAYIKMKKWNELTNYFSELVEEVNKPAMMNNMAMLNIKNAGILGLITCKIDYAEKIGVHIRVQVLNEIKEINMRISELCEVLGVLLDNAIEASSERTDKTVHLLITKKDNTLVFTIENSVNEEVYVNQIFTKGFSTKGTGRGMGLWIVNKILERYDNILLNTFSGSKKFKQDLIIS